MHKVRRKIIFSSISLFVFVITLLATTYAWVGIFTYASTGSFDINLKVNEIDANYFLVISSTGEFNPSEGINTFGDEVSIDDIRLQCLKNLGVNTENLTTSKLIEASYIRETSSLSPVTTLINGNKSFDKFYKYDVFNRNSIYNYDTNTYSMSMEESAEYIKFDLYFSVDTKEGIGEDTEINSNIFLTELEDMLIGKEYNHQILKNNFTDYNYPSTSSDDLILKLNESIPLLKSIPLSKRVKINSANAVRVGFELYEPVNIESNYTGNEKVVASSIYHAGKTIPNYNSDDDIYDFGGIIPTEYNTAAQELMNLKVGLEAYVPENAINRGDLEINEDNSQIWQKPSSYNQPLLGVHNGVRTKMKVSVYLWYEGWDADCLLGLSKSTVSLNLAFTAGTNYD